MAPRFSPTAALIDSFERLIDQFDMNAQNMPAEAASPHLSKKHMENES